MSIHDTKYQHIQPTGPSHDNFAIINGDESKCRDLAPATRVVANSLGFALPELTVAVYLLHAGNLDLGTTLRMRDCHKLLLKPRLCPATV